MIVLPAPSSAQPSLDGDGNWLFHIDIDGTVYRLGARELRIAAEATPPALAYPIGSWAAAHDFGTPQRFVGFDGQGRRWMQNPDYAVTVATNPAAPNPTRIDPFLGPRDRPRRLLPRWSRPLCRSRRGSGVPACRRCAGRKPCYAPP
jgi:hypothetical protein